MVLLFLRCVISSWFDLIFFFFFSFSGRKLWLIYAILFKKILSLEFETWDLELEIWNLKLEILKIETLEFQFSYIYIYIYFNTTNYIWSWFEFLLQQEAHNRKKKRKVMDLKSSQYIRITIWYRSLIEDHKTCQFPVCLTYHLCFCKMTFGIFLTSQAMKQIVWIKRNTPIILARNV